MPPNDVSQFLTAYAESLATFDAERSAALWGTPGTLVSDSFTASVGSREEMVEGLRSSYPLYRALGLAGVRYEVEDTVDLTDALVRVRVRWLFDGEGGELLADSTYEYLLRRDADGLHAYVSVDIDAQEKLADLARRKGIDLSSPPGSTG
ncbi:hypothetical protein FE697_002180 [Mumia zhuanghuii]|uniref:SnoaL-like domain-containing protein n=2 Tax=Mumia TaxID=1546255 RepID=A0ABW1QHI0_9ACTN|nr:MULTISPECIES: hypothetical protein [Mumia]KAA1424748.1 hypothetical protein FE697_002180 [Mumia zhuanghuii]